MLSSLIFKMINETPNGVLSDKTRGEITQIYNALNGLGEDKEHERNTLKRVARHFGLGKFEGLVEVGRGVYIKPSEYFSEREE